jgi:hypothetical protein
MKINLGVLSDVNIEKTDCEVIKMRLSENAQSMVFQMFTKSIYSNPIGSIVRELTSNCFDSHIEANVNTPIVIKRSFDKEANTHYVSFIDYGVGMSPDRVKNIYSVYFESTKRLDNNQIGGFGIGCKVGLAYKRSTGHGEGEYDNSFYVITKFDGTCYYYCIYEGKESPIISLLHSESTTDHNGTEVRVPVLEKDIATFEKEMVRQLYYFENIVFEGFDTTGYSYESTLTNQYQIIRGKHFLYRGTDYSSSIHVCLGRVAYPIDYNVLGLNSSDYNLPIALRLEVGEINVIANREQLDYNEATIKTLKKKLTAAVKEITELLAKQYENIVTLEEYFNVKNDFGTLYFPNGMSLHTGKLISQSGIDFSNFRYNFMKMPTDKQLFKFFFDVKSYGKKPAKRSRYNSEKYEFEGSYEELINEKNKNILYVESIFNRKVVKQAYLKSQHELYHIIGKRNIAANHMRSEIAELFNMHLDATADDNGKPVEYVLSLLEMQEEFFTIVRKHAMNYDTINVPEDFIVNRKNKNILSKEERNSTFPVKFIGGYGSKDRVKVDSIFKYTGRIFYGVQEDEHRLRDAQYLYSCLFGENMYVVDFDQRTNVFEKRYNRDNVNNKKTIMFIMLGKTNVKYMQYCKNAVHINQFYNVMLRRKEDMVLTYFQTYILIDKYNNLNTLYKTVEVFEKLDTKWSKKIAKIKNYIDNIPKEYNNSSINDCRYQLRNYFDVDNVKQNGEQEKLAKIIEDLMDMQELNQDVLQYIEIPHYVENINNTLIDILKKIMIF